MFAQCNRYRRAVEFELSDISAGDIDLLRDAAISLHHHEASVSPSLGGALARDDESYWDFYRSHFKGWWDDGNGFCLIARASGDGEILGFVFCVETIGLAAYETSEMVGYVEEIAVIDRARKLGVGRALMDAACERFRERGHSHYALSTVPGNDDARAFYTRLGMRPVAQKLIGEL